MEWKIKESIPLSEWRPWFAWYPAPCEDGFWRWLVTVERRYLCSYGGGYHEYRELVDD